MKIQIVKADITTLKVDAVVNAANSKLMQGSGVCGAIFKSAGTGLTEACNAIGGCAVGNAVITQGFGLNAKRIIHAVAPKYYLDSEKAPQLLKSAYKKCFNLALENNLSSLAFPCLGTGVYGYPKLEAAEIVLNVLTETMVSLPPDFIVVLCCFENEDFELYTKMFNGDPLLKESLQTEI